jgi:hypothetical protein
MLHLVLGQLLAMHPKLGSHVGYVKAGGAALQRAGHSSPTLTTVDHQDKPEGPVTIEWTMPDGFDPETVDPKRLTEDAAESVALAYVHVCAGWQVKRRMSQGERADWLMQRAEDRLALEISGTTTSDCRARLSEKVENVRKCTLPAHRLAVVVGFGRPEILAKFP